MNLRILIKADGERILQQDMFKGYYYNGTHDNCDWQDVPVHKEPPKPLAKFQCECGIFYENAADAATCGEKFDSFGKDMHSFISKLRTTPLGGHKEPEVKKPREFWIDRKNYIQLEVTLHHTEKHVCSRIKNLIFTSSSYQKAHG